jgi:hypothetical protein
MFITKKSVKRTPTSIGPRAKKSTGKQVDLFLKRALAQSKDKDGVAKFTPRDTFTISDTKFKELNLTDNAIMYGFNDGKALIVVTTGDFEEAMNYTLRDGKVRYDFSNGTFTNMLEDNGVVGNDRADNYNASFDLVLEGEGSAAYQGLMSDIDSADLTDDEKNSYKTAILKVYSMVKVSEGSYEKRKVERKVKVVATPVFVDNAVESVEESVFEFDSI